MNILVINAGSSSLKYQLMNPETGDVSAKGLCERIGIDGRLTHNANGVKTVKEIAMPTHGEAIASVMDALVDAEIGVIKSVAEIDGRRCQYARTDPLQTHHRSGDPSADTSGKKNLR